MGQHKYNPTAIAAKKGELTPKPKQEISTMSQRELDEILLNKIYSWMALPNLERYFNKEN